MEEKPQLNEPVVIVDDDPDLRELLERWLRQAGCRVESYHDGESCLAGLAAVLPSAICLDLTLPGMGGLQVLERIKAHHRQLPVIILTSDATVDSVVTAMQLGAWDYLVKPVERTKLLTTVKNAIERHEMTVRLAQLERETSGGGFPGIVGRSAAMSHLFRQIDRVAESDITVLIQGESGTGKELVARAIHDNSGRASGPFVALNCAAIPESLLESELFGHEKGSFTGAGARRIGKFEMADQGTLFLDEVAELSPPLQAALLRAIQERSFHRLGGSAEVRSDFRLIAATHKDLIQEIERGKFRQDLYFRIAVFELEVPPLRERREDIPLLAERFLETFGGKAGSPGSQLTAEAAAFLQAYSWPGNVRELQNAIQKALVSARGTWITPADLPSRLLRHTEAVATQPSGPATPSPVETASSAAAPLTPAGGDHRPTPGELATLNLSDLERLAIEEAIRRNRGNLSRATEELGIGRTTLYRKLKKYQLEPETESADSE